ncbi:beta-lactamase family protein [Roseateles sp. DAIF2]|uniref:serine hydrolase domain-containing protein n=1 Tax=Roseateles sp. DAIF2 TaxID=2714952 RepID=UPI0018A2EC3E|nr:serine hydrolase domain-containing protein [Roseateles sp. DAIF2]QPF72365.1 beta-lactamase family protein [Roseateles sp. DAIF2]
MSHTKSEQSSTTRNDAVPAAEPTTSAAALDALFQSVNRSDAPGLVVGIAHRGKTIYRRGFGMASLEHAVANTPWTRMRIGSTSKHFACFAALLLAEDGKLDIDAGVRSYLPELPAFAQGEPTLRQLMNHTSGYRCHLDLAFIAFSTAIMPKGSGLTAMARQQEMNFAPGENMVYCNGGYHLLSLVIERQSGMPFERFLQERIFTPLGMVDTASVPSDLEIHAGIATLHEALPPAQGGGWRRGIFPSEEIRGEGAMVSTIDDMLRWLAHLRAPQKSVGSAASWQQMTACARLNNGLVNPYALGLMRHDYRGLEVIHHAGGVVGGSCQMLTVPGHALDIIIIVNGAPVNPMELANQVIDTVLGDAELGPAPQKAAADRFKPMLGARYADASCVIEFAPAPEGRLGLKFLNGPPVPMREEGEQLRIGFEDLAVGPLILSAGQLATEGDAPAALDLHEAGRHCRLERLPASTPDAASLGTDLLGRYRSADLAAIATVFLQDGALRLRIAGSYGAMSAELQTFSPAVYGWSEVDSMQFPPSTGVLHVESIEESTGRVAAFRLNTMRSRHLHFQRLAD